MLKVTPRVSAIVMIVISAVLTSPTIINSPLNLEAYESKASLSVGQKYQPNQLQVKIKASRDNRADRLKRFLNSQDSPMAKDANNLIKVADKYGLDWKLLPAIAGLESQYGKAVAAGSYNPYGWYNGNYYFSSWSAASAHVAREITLRWGYQITPGKIGPYYAASPTWAVRVASFMRLIATYN